MRFSRGTYSNALDLTLICQSGSTEIVSEKCLIHRNCEERERAPQRPADLSVWMPNGRPTPAAGWRGGGGGKP